MASVSDPLIDPELAFRLIAIGSWLLILMGLVKLGIYLLGECFPGAYAKVRSPAAKRFLTGNGNRLVFGLLGVLTVVFGLVFLGLGYLVRYLFTLAAHA